ncbi:hypothetical protein Tco_0255801 [Tanacetum coccineum]
MRILSKDRWAALYIRSYEFKRLDHYMEPTEFEIQEMSQEALDLGFKVLWSKNEGTNEVLEGTAQDRKIADQIKYRLRFYESTAIHYSKVYVSTDSKSLSYDASWRGDDYISTSGEALAL